MKGSIKKRLNGDYRLIFDIEPKTVIDAVTGTAKTKRRQKWVRFRPADGVTEREGRKQAEAKLRELLGTVDRGSYIDPVKTTLIEYLHDWLETNVKPPARRPETYRVYQSIVTEHVAKSPLGSVPLQKLRLAHFESYYANLKLAPSSIRVHHAMITRALNRAVKQRLIAENPERDVETRPKVERRETEAWTGEEARRVLASLRDADAQTAALVALALDSGARKSELLGLQWADVDLDSGALRVMKQLDGYDAATRVVAFGPIKTERGRRTVTLDTGTLALLRTHRSAQAATKLRNRTTYHDHGLVFATDARLGDAELGDPLSKRSISGRLDRVIRSAGVKRITVHGLRHTCATVALNAGVPVHVVSARLGHANAAMTLNVYAHCLKGSQDAAAAAIGSVLYGR